MTIRKRIKDKRIQIDITEMATNNRPLAAFLENVKQFLADFEKPEFHDAIIEYKQRWYEEPDEICVVTFRDETDKEMNKRIEREQRKRDRDKESRQRAKVKEKLEDMREISRLTTKYGLKAVPTAKDGNNAGNS